ncbi:PAS domain-containing protein [Methylobacterium sp. J-076]|uniref:PAS domain-containing protein n=1 Tax=Methylobacterium sp. J-076 TaxID=2836655 RepID=UPI001FBA8AD9|nr:PAS domain-containing protein [Methylobacterium sp. J-076]MCJ2012216.1 PAS domain-containing protein [Methylobacterium sp. J-076]
MPSEIAIDPALRAAGFIGIWNTDVPSASSILDDGAAELLAGDIDLAGRPLPLELALRRTHPEDRDWLFARIRQVRQTGGPVSAEFRVLTASGKVRWVLNQGSLTPDETGLLKGRGAYIDTTHHHTASVPPPRPAEVAQDDPLIAAADHCLDLHAALTRTGNSRLRHLSEMLLFEIGQRLARRMGR